MFVQSVAAEWNDHFAFLQQLIMSIVQIWHRRECDERMLSKTNKKRFASFHRHLKNMDRSVACIDILEKWIAQGILVGKNPLERVAGTK